MDQLRDFLKSNSIGGRVLIAPLPIQLFAGTIREPALFFVFPAHIPADPKGYPVHVDLVTEIVSQGEVARRRDYVEKRADYAEAKVSEYWIVDSEKETITLLVLENHEYTETVFQSGEIVTSKLLHGLSIDVTSVFAVGN